MAYVEKRRQERKDGTLGPVEWRVRYRTPNGNLRTKTFPRKLDADRFVAATTTDVARGEWLDPTLGKVTVADFVNQGFRPTLVNLEPTTRSVNESHLRTHILPAFGRMPLAAVDYTQCQSWVNELSTRRAAATVVKSAQVMSKVMRTAVRSGRIKTNPMAEVSLPTIHESEDVYLTPAQVEGLATSMTTVDPWHRALVWVGCYAGPRIGELAALRWTDLDPMRRTLTIERKVVELAGDGFVEGQTKTKAGRRTLTLPRRVIEEVEQHRDLVWERLGEQPLVFPGKQGGYLRPKNLRRRAWLQAVRAADLEGMTFHDMRHTAVSLWVAAGATDMEVAKWAGHKNAGFTKSRYAHLFPEHGEALADRLDAFIASSTPTPAAGVRQLR